MRDSLLSIQDEQYAIETNNFVLDENIDDNNNNKCNGSNEQQHETDSDDDDDDSQYADYYQTIRAEDSRLEIGYKVTWPNDGPILQLSTCLSETSIAPLFNGTAWAGTRIWRAAIVATQYLLHLSSSSFVTINADTTLIELGCGLGMPGMIIHGITHCYVVLTDMDAIIEQLNTNIRTNFYKNKLNDVNNEEKDHDDEVMNDKQASTSDENSEKICALPLDWSTNGVHEIIKQTSSFIHHPNDDDNDTMMIRGGGYDIILNCDCIFEPLYGTSWKQLLECQIEFLRLNPEALVLTSAERRTNDGIEHYLQAAKAYNIVISHVEKIQIPFDHPNEIEIYQLHGFSEKKTKTRNNLIRIS